MRFFKKAIIFLGVLAVAGLAYWYFDLKKGKEREQREKKEALLFEETEREIVRIAIRKEGEQEIVMQREEKGQDEEQDSWVITSPITTPGDSYAIVALINAIKEGKREEVVWENLEKKSEYKLDEPQYSLRFYYEGDANPNGIDFGIESLDRLKVFALVLGQEKIFSVSVGFRNAVVKNLFDVRDKSLAYFDYDDVNEVSMLSTVGVFFLKRKGDEWYLMPGEVKASRIRTEMLIGNITYGHFVQVEEEEGSNFRKYGLDDPRMIVNFKLEDDSNYMFIVGERIEQRGAAYYYATRTTDNKIFQVKAETVHGLVQTEFDMRDRSIFDFQDDEVSAVVLEKGENSFSFIRDENEEWVFEDTKERIELGYRIDSIVRGMKNAEYEVREPIKRGEEGWNETGIADPTYYVTLRFRDNRPPIRVGLTEKDEEKSMLWLTPDNGETAYFASGYFLSNFPETREELLE